MRRFVGLLTLAFVAASANADGEYQTWLGSVERIIDLRHVCHTQTWVLLSKVRTYDMFVMQTWVRWV